MLPALPSHSQKKTKRKSQFGAPPKEASSLFSGLLSKPQTQPHVSHSVRSVSPPLLLQPLPAMNA